jgi:uncharacterized protein
MDTHEFTVSTGDLDSGGRNYVFSVRAAWMRGALEEHEATAGGPDGKLEIRASKSGTDVVVHGTLSAVLVVPCARCLQPVTVDVRDPVSVLFAPRSSRAAGEAGQGPHSKARSSPRHADKEQEISSEEADTLPYDGETVVLDDLVRDELILETPSFPLCSEDCPGISPSLPPKDEESARRLHVDPRLSPLMRLLDPKE